MYDLLFLAVTAVFAVITLWYVSACDRL